MLALDKRYMGRSGCVWTMKPRRVGKRYAIVSFGICFAFIFSTLMFAMHGCEFEPPHLMGTRV